MISALPGAFSLVFDPYVLAVIFGAAAFGLFVGALPGLTAAMAVALIAPITVFMDPVPAIGAIVASSAMAIFSGDVPATLMRMPGTPASAPYVDDAFGMTRRGQSGLALGLCLLSSVAGGLFGSVILILVSPWLAEFALNFTSYEKFWLACLGLSFAAVLAASSPIKGFIALLIGLLLSSVGPDVMSGFPRFSFGNAEAAVGVNFVSALIGMFAIPELIRSAGTGSAFRADETRVGGVFVESLSVLRCHWKGLVRGSLLGSVIGALPGAGGGIAAWIAVGLSKRFSKEPEKYGHGHPSPIIEGSSANNSGLGGAWIPALVFGIPGDPITAIVIGVLLMKGITPGPLVFIRSADLVYAIFIIFILANVMMLAFGWFAIKGFRYVLRTPQQYLRPIVLLFCIVGAFAVTNSPFGIITMVVLGVLAYLMEENEIPVAPAVLGLVLGGILEQTFIQSMLKGQGDPLMFVSRPISIVLALSVLALWAVPGVLLLLGGRHNGSRRS